MKLSKSIKPISYIKAHASEIINEVHEQKTNYIVTQNGEAKAIILDLQTYEEMEESLAMAKLLALSDKAIAEGRYRPMEEVFDDLDSKIAQLKSRNKKDV